ncbi:MAG: sugar ABC transporter permease [Thermomicrobiales bacterium]
MSQNVPAGAAVSSTETQTIKVSDRPQTSWAKSRERLAWFMVLPSIIIVALVALYPLVQSFRLSFTNARLASAREIENVGLRNYEYLWNSDTFRIAFQNTVKFTVVSVALELVLGMIVALIINSQFRARGLVRTAILIPWAIPTVVSSRLWAYMLNDNYGVINDILVYQLPRFFGWIPIIGDNIANIFPDEKIAFLARPNLSLPSAIAVDVWKTTPFMALLLLAGLQVIPGDVYEAAVVDGASKWKQFWQITLPLLRPAILVALIFRTLDAFRVFDVIFVMFGAKVETLTLSIFTQQTLVDGDRLGRASAASVVIFLCIGAFVLIYTRLVKVEEV